MEGKGVKAPHWPHITSGYMMRFWHWVYGGKTVTRQGSITDTHKDRISKMQN